MREAQPVVLISGLLLLGLAGFMIPCMLLDLADQSPTWRAFMSAGMACAFAGGAMSIAARGRVESLTVRAAFLVTVVSWLILTAFAAIPFLLLGAGIPLEDAVFEAMSGLTTTGSTIMTGLDTQPRGILLWRAILQWIGGIGIVVTAIAILPLLKIGGMQLFRLESSDTSEKILPRATQIANLIGLIYLALTVLCACTYAALGMPAFDAIAHAMTTIATGGFSTSDASMGAFTRYGADMAAVVFMLSGAIPFGVYMLMMRGDGLALFKDSQARAFLSLVAGLVIVVALYLAWSDRYSDGEALRLAAFNVVSIITGTGYATTDYGMWGAPMVALFFIVMFIGGCAGSTACGIKVFRFQVTAIAFSVYLREMVRPHAVAPMRYNGRPLTDETVYSVLSFIFLFFATFAGLAMALSAYGLDNLSAFSAAATAVANVGPGLGADIGPSGTFTDLPAGAKWLLSLGMLLGRLEMFTVLVLFSPAFWRA